MKALKRIALDGVDAVIKLGFDRVWEWSEQFKLIPWLSGVMVETALVPGNNSIDHKLGRVPQGFFLVGFTGATAESYPSMVSATRLAIVLNSADTMAVKIWVWG